MARRGFTLVEVLVVIALLAILAGISIGAYSVVSTKAAVADTNARLEGIGRQVGHYRFIRGECPAGLADVAPSLPMPRWMEAGRFVDAWGRPIRYVPSGKSFRLESDGPDQVPGTADDLSFSN
jgi:prepilin-type N-terminal cleavage/methylation domain-containing protein